MTLKKVKNPLLNAKKVKRQLTPHEIEFRDCISDWLVTYPWLKLWTVTYDRMEERRQQNYTGRAGYVPGHGWTGFQKGTQKGISNNICVNTTRTGHGFM